MFSKNKFKNLLILFVDVPMNMQILEFAIWTFLVGYKKTNSILGQQAARLREKIVRNSVKIQDTAHAWVRMPENVPKAACSNWEGFWLRGIFKWFEFSRVHGKIQNILKGL